MPLLEARDLTKAYGAERVLDGVSLSIRTGERVGLVGNNGSGKTTLGQILSGKETMDSGTVALRRGATMMVLDQEPRLATAETALHVALSGLALWTEARDRYERATLRLEAGMGAPDHDLETQSTAAADLERLGGWDLRHRGEAILGKLGVTNPAATIDTMSGGERRRVALAQILVAEPSIAVLDEPTNHLDVEAIEWLEEYLAESFGGAVLLVTHDRYVLDRVCERTMELEHGKAYVYDGGYRRYIEGKSERLAHETRAEANRQNFLRREVEWLRRGPAARTTKQQARIDRANAALAVQAPKAHRSVQLAADVSRSGKTILELDALVLEAGPADQARRLVDGLTLSLGRGERMGVIGKNGTGKTTLLRAILGLHPPTTGRVVLGLNTITAYLDQMRSDLDDSASVLENVAAGRARVSVGGCDMDVRTYLEGFLFDGAKIRQPVGALSGGERARVILAKLLCSPANLLIFDEPTNDLDTTTLASLEEMLCTFEGSAILVSHDRWFLDRVATSILSFEGGGRVVHQPGNYETYRTLRKEAAERDRSSVDEPKLPARPPTTVNENTKIKNLTYAERLELQTLEKRIEAADATVKELEASLSDPATYAAGPNRFSELAKELATARSEAAALLSRWEALETRREANVK